MRCGACLYLTGGIIQRTRGAVGTIGAAGGTGYVKRYSYDACAFSNPPPYFPTTGHFARGRYFEVALSGFDVASYFALLSARQGRGSAESGRPVVQPIRAYRPLMSANAAAVWANRPETWHGLGGTPGSGGWLPPLKRSSSAALPAMLEAVTWMTPSAATRAGWSGSDRSWNPSATALRWASWT